MDSVFWVNRHYVVFALIATAVCLPLVFLRRAPIWVAAVGIGAWMQLGIPRGYAYSGTFVVVVLALLLRDPRTNCSVVPSCRAARNLLVIAVVGLSYVDFYPSFGSFGYANSITIKNFVGPISALLLVCAAYLAYFERSTSKVCNQIQARVD